MKWLLSSTANLGSVYEFEENGAFAPFFMGKMPINRWFSPLVAGRGEVDSGSILLWKNEVGS